MSDKKKIILLIGLVIVLLLIACVILLFVTKDKTKKEDVLKVTYVRNEFVKINNLSKTYTKEFTVENTGTELEAYTVEWKDVSNKVKDQNNFTYEIKGEGDHAASLSKSQVPIVESTIFPSVAILAGTTQKYTITFKYTGKSIKNHSFEGTLKVKSLEVNKEPKKEKKKDKEEPKKEKKHKSK